MAGDPTGLLADLREARAGLARLEVSLQRPSLEVWEQAGPQLQEAAGLLGSVERSVRSTPSLPLALQADIKADLHALARDVRRVDALMRAAAEFYAGWAQLVGEALTGYTPSGTVAVANAALPRLTVRG